MKGKLIVLYGSNNLGKSTQVEKLEKALLKKSIPVKRIKYPLYDLEPTGPVINAVLREGKQMPEEELQRTYVQNRKDYEPTLKQILAEGTSVIAEDYVGTGIAWGLVRGVELTTLEEMNQGLYPADVAILIHGERFQTGREATHRNETDETIWQLAQEKHRFLAERYGWKKVLANDTVENVHSKIMDITIEALES